MYNTNASTLPEYSSVNEEKNNRSRFFFFGGGRGVGGPSSLNKDMIIYNKVY